MPGRPPSLREATYERALEYLLNGHRPHAQITADRVLEGDPDHLGALLIRAMVAESFDIFEDASADYEHAIAIDGTCALAYLGRGRCRARIGDVEGALADMRHAEELDPDECPLDLRAWRRAVDVARERSPARGLDIALLKAEVSAIRNLPFKREVRIEPLTLEEFTGRVEARLDAGLHGASRADVERGLRRLGLLRGATDLGTATVKAHLAQAAAYYDPQTATIFDLGRGLPVDILEQAAVREFAHALQDQNLDLDELFAHAADPADSPRNVDRALATQAVYVGDATFVRGVWFVGLMGRTSSLDQSFEVARLGMSTLASANDEQLIKMTRSAAASHATEHPVGQAAAAMETLPRYALIPLLTAAVTGARMVAQAHVQAGWDGVTRLYRSPPDSTEQCLHPERFSGARDRPTPLRLPELPELEAAGFRRVDTAVHGELHMRLLLAEHGLSEEASRTASEGWDGDIYAAYTRGSDEVAIVLATTWDTKHDASEFSRAYREALSAKYPDLALEDVTGGGDVHLYGCGGRLGHGAVRLRDREVFVVEGVSRELRSQVLARLGRMAIEHVD